MQRPDPVQRHDRGVTSFPASGAARKPADPAGLLPVDLPVVAAPMAGGATVPALVAAAAAAGGFGFLAAGYKSPEAVAAELAEVRGLPVGVNVFVPSPSRLPEEAFRRYARQIAPEGEPYGLDLAAAEPRWDDDAWTAKVDLLLADPVPVVSFTFGLPPRSTVDALRRAGSRVLVTVTDADEAGAAAELGIDGLIVQGADAGAHSGVHDPARPPSAVPLPSLLAAVRRVTGLPLLAAGGLATAEQVRDVVAAGAVAAMVGTALLRTDESGAGRTHRDALVDPRYSTTVLTRAFTGRPARGLRNGFIQRHEAAAPLGYPEVHHLTRPLRSAAAAAGDADRLHLWAGTGHRLARTGPAGAVLDGLAGRL
jgi:NAD(P)H-dependent flavin oxidoreductase YrpB (nitropropane dioxygenase family)